MSNFDPNEDENKVVSSIFFFVSLSYSFVISILFTAYPFLNLAIDPYMEVVALGSADGLVSLLQYCDACKLIKRGMNTMQENEFRDLRAAEKWFWGYLPLNNFITKHKTSVALCNIFYRFNTVIFDTLLNSAAILSSLCYLYLSCMCSLVTVLCDCLWSNN